MTQLNNQIKAINKELGEGTINEMSAFSNIQIERIPTGVPSLDWCMGGGLPRGRIIEIYGEPASGKTLMSLFFIKEIQKSGGKAAFLDIENAFSIEFAKNIGVNVNDLIFSQAVCAEEVLEIINKLVKTNELDVIVIDSVASLVPKKELEGEVGDVQIALTARLMSKALRMITGIASQSKTSIIFLNQTRQKLNLYYGPQDTTPGGKALKFYSSIRLQVKKGKTFEDSNKDAIGNLVKIEVRKNKVGTPFRKTEFGLFYNSGIDVLSDIYDTGVQNKVITKDGNTYLFQEKKLAVGIDATKQYLKDHPELLDKIRKEIYKTLNIN